MNNTSFEIKPVTLEDKDIIDSYFRERSPMNSEFTFTNLFMWQKSYNICYAIIHESLCIFSKHIDDIQSVCFPVGGDAEKALGVLLEYFQAENTPFVIRLFTREQKSFLKHCFPNMFDIEKDINSFDYVYKSSDLSELEGKRYHAKRNHINKFKALYDFEYHKMTPDFREDCRKLFAHWCETKKDNTPDIDEQLDAVNRLLDNWESLDITGGCITVEGKLIAFSFGELLCRNCSMAVIHLEHADTDFQGSFPMINQQFVQHEWSHLQFINREEDMGLEGLRKAKKSYYPVFMVEKYCAVLK